MLPAVATAAVLGAIVGSAFPGIGKGIRFIVGNAVEGVGDALSKVGRFVSGEESYGLSIPGRENLTQEVGLFVNYLMDAKEKGKISKEELNSLMYGLVYYLKKERKIENAEEFVLNAYESTRSQFAQAQKNPDLTEELERTVAKIAHAVKEREKERILEGLHR